MPSLTYDQHVLKTEHSRPSISGQQGIGVTKRSKKIGEAVINLGKIRRETSHELGNG